MLIMNEFVLHLLCIMKVLSFGGVKAYLEGIWHDSNESLDLTKLHQEILELKNAKLDFNAAKAAEDILEKN